MALKTTTFWKCTLTDVQLLPPMWQRHQAALRHQYTFSQQHDITSQKTMTFTVTVLETSFSHRWYWQRVMAFIFTVLSHRDQSLK